MFKKVSILLCALVSILSMCAETAQAQGVVSFTLINADTDTPIPNFDPLQSGDVINIAALPTANLNVRANTSPAIVGSVKFILDNITPFRTENLIPYALIGDSNGDYKVWNPGLGQHTITATPYTAPNGGGTAGNPLTINVTFIDDSSSGQVSINPGSHNFGGVNIGESSAPFSFNIVNSGGTPVTVSDINVIGSNSSNFSLNGSTSFTLQSGDSSAVNIAFSPIIAGSHTAQIEVISDDVSSPHKANLSGVGIDPSSTGNSVVSLTLIDASTNSPVAGFNPIQEGDVVDIASLPSQHCNIRADTSPTVVGSVKFGLNGNPNFKVENVVPYAMLGDENGIYNKWSPSVGSYAVTATPYSGSGASGSAGNAVSVNFTVIDGGSSGSPGPLSVNPSNFGFGNLTVGQNSAPVNITVTNNGSQDVAITQINLTGSNPAQFSLGENAPYNLNSGQSINITASYSPSSTGSHNATIQILSNAIGNPDTISLSGTGTNPSPGGGTTLYRINAGGSAYTDANGNDWGVDSGYNGGKTYSTTAAISGTNLDPTYQSERYDQPPLPELIYNFPVNPGPHVVRLHFAEIYDGAFSNGARVFDVAIEGQVVLDNYDIFAAVGSNTAVIREFNVQVNDNDLQIEFLHEVENPKISGIEIIDASSLAVSPNQINFGQVDLGQTAQSQLISMTNNDSVTHTINSLSFLINQGAGYDFKITTSIGNEYFGDQSNVTYPVNIPINSGVTDNLIADFIPTEININDVMIELSGTWGTTQVQLLGQGESAGGGGLLINPASNNYGSTVVGQTSSTLNINLTNNETADINITQVNLVGANPAEFNLVENAPYTLINGQTIQIQASHAPITAGSHTASIEIISDASSSPDTVNLSGTGTNPSAGGGQALYRINSGGSAYTDANGDDWAQDSGFNGGQTFSTTAGISGTLLDPTYQTERYDEAPAPELIYSFPVSPGSYRVRLHFAEIWNGAFTVGARVFNVVIEGQSVLNNYDIFADVGSNAAAVKEFNVNVNDSDLQIELQHVTQNPKISGIEIFDASNLSVSPAFIDFGHINVGNSAQSEIISITNNDTNNAAITSLSFLVNQGAGHDFTVTTSGGAQYSGQDIDVTFSTNISIGPGQTENFTVDFSPTELQENDVSLELSGNFGTSQVQLMGEGGNSTGDPFLHVVIEAPAVVVDFDGSGSENIMLLGSSSHTHEFGRVLSTFEWRENGNIFSSQQDVTQAFSLGQHTVSLTIYDDNNPPRTFTDSFTFNVVNPDEVPGSLVLYYSTGGGSPENLLDNVPANADYGENLAGFYVQANNSNISGTPYTDNVMVRMVGQLDIAQTNTYNFQLNGGSDNRLYIDGSAFTGPLNLSAGRHDIEARFAVNGLGDLPLEIRYAQGSASFQSIDPALISHDQLSIIPVINTAPGSGISSGGNTIIITGLGFLPVNQVSVNWGSQVLSGNDLTVQSDLITLTAPSGAGTISVNVQTPNGTSDSFSYTYSTSGPAPINFTVSNLVTGISNPTQGDWGPDGRFYTGSTDGTIKAFTFDDNYNLTNTQTITVIENLSNPNILGIGFNPFDTSGQIKIYVAHSQLFANGGACFSGFSSYSGQISVLTGPNFNSVSPLVTGLPVSNHDHGINGLQFTNQGDLLFAVGGNTNAGVAGDCEIGQIPESPLSGAIVKAEISKPNFNGTIQYVETGTSIINMDQNDGNIVDVIDGVDVYVHGVGQRNSFDCVLTTLDNFYCTDNGPNNGFGQASVTANTQGPDPSAGDTLDRVFEGGYFGHPNRNRGRYDNRQNTYRNNSEQSTFGNFTQAIESFTPSTNGIIEYRATTFNNAMYKDLVAERWNNTTYRVTLSSDGLSVVDKNTLPALTSLDVVQGPGGVLIGVDLTDNKLVIARPNDSAANGMVAYDIFPWRASAAGGTNFVIGGAGFGSMGNTSVSVGGVQANINSVTSTRIRGTIPGNPTTTTALKDVVVNSAGSVATIPKAFRYIFPNGQGRGTWKPGPSLPNSVGEISAGFINGVLYVVGEDSNVTQAFDLATNTWRNNLDQRPFLGNHQAAEIIDGKFYLFGGLGGNAEGRVQYYNPEIDSWNSGTTGPWAFGSASSALIDGKVYVCGGIVGNGTVTTCGIYNPDTNLWSTAMAPMPAGRNHAASATDGKKMYIFGGRGPGSGNGNTVAPGFDDVQIYDPSTNFWETSFDNGSTIPPVPQKGGGMGKAVYFGGEFYVMGGETNSFFPGTFNRVDVYNPVTKTWRSETPMPTARHGIFPLAYDGKIFVAAGGTQQAHSNSKILEIFSR